MRWTRIARLSVSRLQVSRDRRCNARFAIEFDELSCEYTANFACEAGVGSKYFAEKFGDQKPEVMSLSLKGRDTHEKQLANE